MQSNPLAPQRYTARTSIVGEDTPIRRALPHARRRMVGAWCFLDHAGPVQFAPGQGLHVGVHPHIGLQTFTWMIEGEIIHRDSLGYEQVIRPGQVNLMTAGHGIAHTEDSVADGTRLHAAQLWIALPDAERQREPAFANYAQLPKVQANGFVATVLAGTALGQTAPTQVYSPLVGIDLLAQSATHTLLPLNAAFEYGVLVLRGNATVQGEVLAPGELLYFAPGRSTMDVYCDDAAQLLLLGGEPFSESIVLWWNFVARSQDELASALADWNTSQQAEADSNTNVITNRRFGRVRPGCKATPLKAPSLDGVQLKTGK